MNGKVLIPFVIGGGWGDNGYRDHGNKLNLTKAQEYQMNKQMTEYTTE